VRSALHTLGIAQFLPTWSEDVRWSDRMRERIRPLFPGYIFARMSPLDMVPACTTNGVVQILPNSFHPSPIVDEEIELVRRLASRNAVPCDYLACDYLAGEAVTIDSGPLAGVSGTVVRTRGATLVVVEIEMFRSCVRVDVDAATLVKKEPAKKEAA
jgi:transcriptional antiterminator RfaH